MIRKPRPLRPMWDSEPVTAALRPGSKAVVTLQVEIVRYLPMAIEYAVTANGEEFTVPAEKVMGLA